jgi:hypothetical protein
VSALAGPLHLVALVLVVSGAQKVLRPEPAAQAMADAGLPVPRGARRVAGIALGVIEAATGLAVFAAPHPAAALWLGAFYLALAGFVVLLRRRDATAGCGCFGAASTPPTTAHVVLNVVAALVAVGAAATTVTDVVDVVDQGVGVAAPYAVLVVLGTGLVLLAPTLLADLRQIGQDSGHPAVRPFGPTRPGPSGARS